MPIAYSRWPLDIRLTPPQGGQVTTVDLRALSADSGGSRTLSGYFSQPTSSGPWPGLVVIHEAFGLDEQARRHVERFASIGYLTLAPDLFSDGGARRCLVSTMRAMSSGKGRAYADIEAARQWLLQREGCTGRIGVIGFCMGGGFALMTVTGGFDVCSANYAMLPRGLDAALAGACPIVGSYGGRDRGLRGAAAKLDTALTAAAVVHDVKEYPRAGHAFLNETMAGPRVLWPLFKVMGMGPEPDSAADAWRRIDAFLAEQLAG